MAKYSIQEHDATKKHWDLRIQKGLKLKSWAITKVPPKKAGIKRLAIQTPDHALSYWDFEGEIEEGKYGAGTVKIWDIGTCEVEKYTPSEIIVDIKGKKLKGKYVLIKFKMKNGKDGWLFFKKK